MKAVAARPWLFVGSIFHKRFFPKTHQFRYPLFFLKFDLSRMDELKNSVFSVNGWNLFSIHTKDYGDHSGQDLFVWAQSYLRENGVGEEISRVELQTFPRVLGYAFNPVNFWFCHSEDRLVSVIAEVHNTFGGEHRYLVRVNQDGSCEVQTKKFHVSPFFKVEGRYEFDFLNCLDSARTDIQYYNGSMLQLYANIEGRAQEFMASSLLRVFVKFPFMTLFVILGIHFEAIRLYFKGLPFFGKDGRPETHKEERHVHTA